MHKRLYYTFSVATASTVMVATAVMVAAIMSLLWHAVFIEAVVENGRILSFINAIGSSKWIRNVRTRIVRPIQATSRWD